MNRFDITTGSYDGAEICELVGLYTLSILGKVYGIQKVGFYWDHGLACWHKISGPDQIVNFLDVTFDLCTGKYQAYKKPKDTPTYINVNSNPPPNITKALPESISKRINNISSDKAIFNNAAPFYNNVLSASENKENLTYQKDLEPSNKVRQRKITL